MNRKDAKKLLVRVSDPKRIVGKSLTCLKTIIQVRDL